MKKREFQPASFYGTIIEGASFINVKWIGKFDEDSDGAELPMCWK